MSLQELKKKSNLTSRLSYSNGLKQDCSRCYNK
nr:MAG TPA: hypothetical protein [Crassvirales sp.]